TCKTLDLQLLLIGRASATKKGPAQAPSPLTRQPWQSAVGLLFLDYLLDHHRPSGAALFRRDLAVMIGVHLVKVLERHGLRLGQSDLPVMIAIGHDDHPAAAHAAHAVHAEGLLLARLCILH